MFNKFALANSLAILMGVFYVFFVILNLLAPPLFEFLFNAQFLGAEVSVLLPQEFSLSTSLTTFVILVTTGWVLGFLWAWLYNLLSK